jgi:hypothetical protein
VDQKDLGVARYDGGHEYLEAIRSLKLEPDALFWAYDKAIEQFVLVLVTSLFDYAGPLALTRLLFDAYNASATPKDIDPFIIRLHSPKHALYREAQVHIGNRYDQADLKGSELDWATIAGTVTPTFIASFTAGDLTSFGTWVYKSTPAVAKAATGASERRWTRFERAVHAVAA